MTGNCRRCSASSASCRYSCEQPPKLPPDVVALDVGLVLEPHSDTRRHSRSRPPSRLHVLPTKTFVGERCRTHSSLKPTHIHGARANATIAHNSTQSSPPPRGHRHTATPLPHVLCPVRACASSSQDFAACAVPRKLIYHRRNLRRNPHQARRPTSVKPSKRRVMCSARGPRP